MGQTCFGVMYGCEYEPPEDWEAADRIYDAARKPVAGVPGGTAYDEERALVGLWVAVGGSGREGAGYLCGSLPLGAEGVEASWPDELRAAREGWSAFADALRGAGASIGEPRLWLVETETS